jgi:hypothetical protein
VRPGKKRNCPTNSKIYDNIINRYEAGGGKP